MISIETVMLEFIQQYNEEVVGVEILTDHYTPTGDYYGCECEIETQDYSGTSPETIISKQSCKVDRDIFDKYFKNAIAVIWE